jgi:hypothetical protein
MIGLISQLVWLGCWVLSIVGNYYEKEKKSCSCTKFSRCFPSPHLKTAADQVPKAQSFVFEYRAVDINQKSNEFRLTSKTKTNKELWNKRYANLGYDGKNKY